MARKLRVEYPGAIYHIVNRGDRKELIFRDYHDRKLFLKTLSEACTKTDWMVHAYVLMPNHFHLVLETPKPNLVTGMKWLLGTYTIRFNRRHKVTGHLFSGRYKSLIVDGSQSGYLKTVCDYVHLNPARAELIRTQSPLKTFRWSSWSYYLSAPSNRPAWLYVNRLLGEYRIPKDNPAGRRRLESDLEGRRANETNDDYRPIRRGWFFGEDDIKKELLQQMDHLGPEHYGIERHEVEEQKANRIISDEMKKRKWRSKDLKHRLKGDPDKVEIAQRLREETVMPVSWIADHLQMGTRNYLNSCLYKWRRKNLP